MMPPPFGLRQKLAATRKSNRNQQNLRPIMNTYALGTAFLSVMLFSGCSESASDTADDVA